MGYKCKILLDSISETDKRITTFELIFPKEILADILYYRAFSRNYIIEENIVIIILTATEFDNFFKLRCDENAQYGIRRIADLMYEAYHAYDKVIDKEKLALNRGFIALKDGYSWDAIPINELKVGEWHCPLTSEKDIDLIYTEKLENHEHRTVASLLFHKYGIQIYNQGVKEVLKMISVARCARVSYLTHENKRSIAADLELFKKLRTSGHYSPFEHVATPSFNEVLNEFAEVAEFENLRNANFIGWRAFRTDLPNENCTNFKKEN